MFNKGCFLAMPNYQQTRTAQTREAGHGQRWRHAADQRVHNLESPTWLRGSFLESNTALCFSAGQASPSHFTDSSPLEPRSEELAFCARSTTAARYHRTGSQSFWRVSGFLLQFRQKNMSALIAVKTPFGLKLNDVPVASVLWECWGSILNFLLDNVFIQVGVKAFQQCMGVPFGTNCASL